MSRGGRHGGHGGQGSATQCPGRPGERGPPCRRHHTGTRAPPAHRSIEQLAFAGQRPQPGSALQAPRLARPRRDARCCDAGTRGAGCRGSKRSGHTACSEVSIMPQGQPAACLVLHRHHHVHKDVVLGLGLAPGGQHQQQASSQPGEQQCRAAQACAGRPALPVRAVRVADPSPRTRAARRASSRCHEAASTHKSRGEGRSPHVQLLDAQAQPARHALAQAAPHKVEARVGDAGELAKLRRKGGERWGGGPGCGANMLGHCRRGGPAASGGTQPTAPTCSTTSTLDWSAAQQGNSAM